MSDIMRTAEGVVRAELGATSELRKHLSWMKDVVRPAAELQRMLEAGRASLDAARVVEACRPTVELQRVIDACRPRAEELAAMRSIAKDVAEFRGSLTGISEFQQMFSDRMALTLTFDNGISEALRAVRESARQWQETMAAASLNWDRVKEHMAPFGEQLRWLAEEQKVVVLVQELGFVPHTEVWELVDGIDVPVDEEARRAFREEFAGRIWPELRGQLALSQDQCLGDERLRVLYEQMQRAQDEGLHEGVVSMLATLLERAARVAEGVDVKRSAFEWLSSLGDLPLSYMGGLRGFRVWQLLLDEVYSGCWEDASADNGRYPNRHATAHGFGSRVASCVDGVNAVLLAHFVMTMAGAVKRYREDLAA